MEIYFKFILIGYIKLGNTGTTEAEANDGELEGRLGCISQKKKGKRRKKEKKSKTQTSKQDELIFFFFKKKKNGYRFSRIKGNKRIL